MNHVSITIRINEGTGSIARLRRDPMEAVEGSAMTIIQTWIACRVSRGIKRVFRVDTGDSHDGE